MPAERKKTWGKDEGTCSRRRKTWFEVAGVRVVTRLHEIFMGSPEEGHVYLDSRSMTAGAWYSFALSNWVPAHSLAWSFPHERGESLRGRDEGELLSWESNLLDKSLASNMELLCKSKIRQG